MEKIKLTAVSYLNTKPFLYGIFQSGLDKQMEIAKDIPSICAQKLIDGEVDIALIPVAALKNLKNHYIVSDFCIGCDGPVQTVCLYTNVPIWEVKTIYLDSHSRTSAALTKILVKEFWKNLEVSYKPVEQVEGMVLEENAAVLAIGDKTIGMDKQYRHTYDLGALALGLSHIDELTFILPDAENSFDLKTYFEKYISYELDDKKKAALRLFLSKIDQTTRPEDAIQPVFV